MTNLVKSASEAMAVEQSKKIYIVSRWAILAILFFSLAQFSIITFVRYLRFPDEGTELLLPRGVVTVVGAGLATIILYAQSKLKTHSLLLRAASAIMFALGGCILHGIVNEIVFSLFYDSEFTLIDYVLNTLNWFWFYLSLSTLFLALRHGTELAESRVQIASLKTQTTLAQLSALRYQLNPHFLFNTLNSIAALVVENQPTEAELMIRRLSTFLRGGLATDPLISIPLAAEITQQSLYLEIERTRFPNRLAFHLDIPDAVADALVPSLILQPLVENAVKYGMSPSGGLTTISISARDEDGILRIEVNDDGEGPPPTGSGVGIGIANVRQRLAGEYGDQASFEAHATERGYLVTLRLPLRRAAA